MEKPGYGFGRFAALCVYATLAGCADAGTPSEPERARSETAMSRSETWTEDDEMERVAREEVPGFAGYVVADDGTPVVLLVNPGQRTAAERWVRAQRGRQGLPPGLLRVQQARWDFPTLRRWQEALFPLMTRGLVFASDVDEAQNRVWVAVSSAQAAGAVREEAARLGIPAGMLEVEVRARPEPRVGLTDQVRPSVAGLRIISGEGKPCSIGFYAIMNGSPVVVTASHCSNRMYYRDGSQLYQPEIGPENQITMAEIADPPVEVCFLSHCRKSDASAWSLAPGATFSLGRIARPTYYGANEPGSLEIDPERPTFQITSKNTDGLPVGTWVDKVGAVSGWTRGQIKKRCVDIKTEDVRYGCQYVTSTWSQHGDSGSPIFAVGTSGVDLHGILWGGPVGNWGETWYSPIGGIQKDFGASLTVH